MATWLWIHTTFGNSASMISRDRRPTAGISASVTSNFRLITYFGMQNPLGVSTGEVCARFRDAAMGSSSIVDELQRNAEVVVLAGGDRRLEVVLRLAHDPHLRALDLGLDLGNGLAHVLRDLLGL